jgi:ribulose-5-phosphate 4-epimerase/fuculose-1-phosphate aldolase
MMNDGPQNKQLLDGYVGVKFEAVQRSKDPRLGTEDLYVLFRRNCDRLKAYHMTPANGGNVSIRHGNGFIISASGSNLGYFEEDELSFVEQCDEKKECVIYHGQNKPSSESIMHWLIYENRPEAHAIIHAHDEFATRPELLAGDVEESEREEPYGTIELALMAIATFKQDRRIIVLKNHGYVAIGPDLDRTCDLVVGTHLKLLGKQEGLALDFMKIQNE